MIIKIHANKTSHYGTEGGLKYHDSKPAIYWLTDTHFNYTRFNSSHFWAVCYHYPR